MEDTVDYRSDKAVKQCFIKLLRRTYGKKCKCTKSDKADICAHLDNGKKYLFELKKVSLNDKNVIFSAASLTEWEAAIDKSVPYFFVIAIELIINKKYDFHIIAPEDFMKYSYIPPFKIYFNIPYTKEDNEIISFGVPGRNKDSYVIQNNGDIETLQTAWENIGNLKLGEKRKKVKNTDDFTQITSPEQLKEIIVNYTK